MDPTCFLELLVFGSEGADVLVQPDGPNPFGLQLPFQLVYSAGPFTLNVFSDFPTRFGKVALVIVCNIS